MVCLTVTCLAGFAATQQPILKTPVCLQVQYQLMGAGIKAGLLEFWMERYHEAWLHKNYGLLHAPACHQLHRVCISMLVNAT